MSAVRFVDGTDPGLHRRRPSSGPCSADIGLDQLELPTEDVPTFAELSAEELTLADADIVLYSSYGPAEDSGETAALGGPLWPRLRAVQGDRALAVEDDVFFTGIGLTAANLMIEDLADRLG